MKKVRRSPFVLLAALTVFIGLPATSFAAPITFIFDGEATFVQPLLAGTFSVGDRLSGTITYDSGLTDADSSPTIGLFPPISSLTFTLGSYTATYVSGTGFVTVANGQFSDQLAIRGDVTGPRVNNFSPFSLVFNFSGSGSTFTDDSLPLAFDSTSFTNTRFFFDFTNRSNPYDTTSPGTNFTGVQGTFSGSAGNMSPVPEPATMGLFASGLAALTPWLRRKRQSLRS